MMSFSRHAVRSDRVTPRARGLGRSHAAAGALPRVHGALVDTGRWPSPRIRQLPDAWRLEQLPVPQPAGLDTLRAKLVALAICRPTRRWSQDAEYQRDRRGCAPFPGTSRARRDGALGRRRSRCSRSPASGMTQRSRVELCGGSAPPPARLSRREHPDVPSRCVGARPSRTPRLRDGRHRRAGARHRDAGVVEELRLLDLPAVPGRPAVESCATRLFRPSRVTGRIGPPNMEIVAGAGDDVSAPRGDG